jgi:DNA-binding MarR family transcriptional regulator
MGDAKGTVRATMAPGKVAATSPRSADDESAGQLGLAVMRLARRLRQETPPGITPTQLSALAVIGHAGPIAMAELAAIESVQPPTMSRIVAALEEGGWVEREADRTDRRVTLVRATPKAKAELARVRSERNAYLARKLNALEAADAAAVIAAIPALERLLLQRDDSQPDEP